MEPSQEGIDPVAKREALAVAGVRLGLGVAILAATRRSLAGLGFKNPDPATVALARLAGGRDVALGLHGLLGASDRRRLREAVALGTLVDAGDALAFGTALIRREGIDRTAAMNAPIGAAAAVAGLWILRRL